MTGVEAFLAKHELALSELLAFEIKRDHHRFVWRAVPRASGPPQFELFQVGALDRDWLCKIVPQVHVTTSRTYFVVEPAKPNLALTERGATFDKLKQAVAWCSANDWLVEAPVSAPAPPPVEEAKANGHAPHIQALVEHDAAAQTAPKPFKPGNEVNHPAHYNMGSIEVIDALEAWNVEAHEFNVIKYTARAEHKGNRIGDLEKALWYLQRKIHLLKGIALREPNADEIEDAISDNPPGIYQHYKGGYYRLMEIALHHETRLPLAIYVPVNDDHSAKPGAEISVRPIFPTAWHDADAWTTQLMLRDGTRTTRFKLVKSAVTQA